MEESRICDIFLLRKVNVEAIAFAIFKMISILGFQRARNAFEGAGQPLYLFGKHK